MILMVRTVFLSVLLSLLVGCESNEFVVPEVKVEDKILLLDEVLEEDEWIILEVNGKKNVYDISNWIPNHPGGSAILNGVEANKHYQDPDLYPDSPTDLFKGNHAHSEANAWETYVKKNNDMVQLIGYIK